MGEHEDGKEKLPCPSRNRAHTDVPADPLWLLWTPDGSGGPHPTHDYHVTRKLSAHPARAPVSESSMRVVSSRLSARGRR